MTCADRLCGGCRRFECLYDDIGRDLEFGFCALGCDLGRARPLSDAVDYIYEHQCSSADRGCDEWEERDG